MRFVAISLADRMLKANMLGENLKETVRRAIEEIHVTEGAHGLFCFGPEKDDATLIVGDSHAGVLKLGMRQNAQLEQRRIFATSYGHASMFNLNLESAQNIFRIMEEHPSISRIILAQWWAASEVSINDPENQRQLRGFIGRMQSLGKKVYIASDVAYLDGPRWGTQSVLARKEMFAPRFELPEWEDILHGQTMERYEAMQGGANKVLSEICRDTGAVLVPLQASL